ncbi:MAG TPA: RNB domain-containing ribonuclease, partial [Rubrobacter sp.]|nr:RNB domain-containing ribonuclease [Rubrobacter sp.]
GRSLRGEVTKVLGPADDPRNVYEALFASINTYRGFSPKIEEAAATSARTKPGEREDLRSLATVTIDGADAKDFDDAISVEHVEGEAGGYRLWVHIADVTHYVRPESPLDREASRRGNSVYLPGTVAPMLPARLSEDVCSLRPGEEKATVTVEMEVARSGEVKKSRAYRSLIVSDARLTYEGVDEFLRGEGEIRQPGLVRAAYELSRRLKTRAAVRGKLELGGREPEYEVDERGVPVSARVRRSTPARQLIEELMVLANEAVAGMLRGKPGGIYRVHERPDEEDMEKLGERLAAVGVDVRPTPENLGTISQKAKSDAVNYLILRSMPRASYSPASLGHYGLALENYTHFTSPIRRYSDVLVHRALLPGGEEPDDMTAVAGHVSEREWQSTVCERTADQYTLMWLMRDRVGEHLEGVVVSTAAFGLFVELRLGQRGWCMSASSPGGGSWSQTGSSSPTTLSAPPTG